MIVGHSPNPRRLPRVRPAASDVTVRLTRIGYGAIRYEGVPVHLGTTTSLGDISFDPQPVEIADIVVSGAKPVIDPASAASRTTLDSSQFLSLPSGRDFRALIPFVPQANASSYSNANPTTMTGSTSPDPQDWKTRSTSTG